MKYIKDIIISTEEPPVNNIAWLQPQSNNTNKLFIYGSNGWASIAPGESGKLSFKYIQDIPDIITNKD